MQRVISSFLCLISVPGGLYAQFPPAFDVVSVKPSPIDATERSLTHNAGGRLTTSNATVRMLILLAYQVMPYQLSGGPEWINTDGFDIEAKAANLNSTPEQFRKMVQMLLAERFQLKVHTETREMAIYALQIAKGGPKLTPAAGDEQNPGVRNGRGETTGVRASMAMLATALTRPLQRKVVDETGLKGDYTFTLKFDPAEISPSESNALPEISTAGSIFTAVTEQLGLRLKVTKGPVEVLVIDRAARAMGN
ncbi:MAG TPA: TIGR03435 family protein [Verrucomicrobiae bacterium]|nr:TIGR03435 family protein [Verrucomicrobiae bacterium]